MSTAEATKWGGGGEGFIFRSAITHSDSHGASLGGYAFALILVAWHDGAQRRNDWEAEGGFYF